MSTSLPLLFCRLWRHLSRRRRAQTGFILLLMAFSTLSEVLSLGAVIPFLGVLVSPEKVFQQPAIAGAARFAGYSQPSELVLPLTLTFVCIAIFAGGLRLVVLWASTRLSFAAGVDLSQDIYRRTLYQPYSAHVARNSSEVVSAIVNKVGVTLHFLFQCLTLVSAAFLTVAVVIALFVIDVTVASITVVTSVVCYGLITRLARRRLDLNSETIARESTALLKTLQEGLGGIRDVLLEGSQPLYCEMYRQADVATRKAQAANLFIAGGPRYVMETLGMVLIASLAYVASNQPTSIAGAIPVLGALAIGAQRLLPALQQSYAAWSGIAGSRASLIDVLSMLEQEIPADALLPSPPALELCERIEFDHVRFRYDVSLPFVVDDFSLVIPRGARVALVGSTGSGKSTLTDLLMGLIDPVEGAIRVDGLAVDRNSKRAWQRAIAHVPQAIFLADRSLAENIAFGLPAEEIDMERVTEAARRAQLADFIERQPEGYKTIVGERGVRLSGGQRQRIGIARAFYKRARVLIFDEATSALDNATEQAVMEAVQQLGRDLTVIIVAHRLSTVRGCDMIVQLEGGRAVAQGRYDALVVGNPQFRALVAAGL